MNNEELKNFSRTGFYYPIGIKDILQTMTGVRLMLQSNTVRTEEKASKPICMKVDCYGDRTFRIRFSLDEKNIEHDTPMLVPLKKPEGLETNLDPNIELKLKQGKIVIEKDDFSIKFYSCDNEKIVEIPSNRIFDWKSTLKTQSFDNGGSDGILEREYCQLSSSDDSNFHHTTFEMQTDEKIFGLGEQFSSFNHRGKFIDIRNQDARGNFRSKTYIGIPFYISSQGYGVFINSLRPVAIDLGSSYADFSSIYVSDSLMDIFVIIGPSFSDILSAYADLTGHAPTLPRWSYGLWASRAYYKDRNETQDVAERFRKEQIPCDVISFDCNWFKNGPWVCDLKFSETTFPNPKEMFGQLEEQGFKSCVWQLPCVHTSLKNFEEGKDKGYFVKRKDGSVYIIKLDLGSIGEQSYGHIDFTNQDAVKWYADQIKDVLRLGARVVKADMADLCPEDGVYAGGDGKEINALFPLLYNRMMYDAAQDIYGPGNGIVWARSSCAGGQRYPLVWSGDPYSMFNHMAGSLRGGLSLALTGHPFWSDDIGGYFGQPSEKLFIRWAQMGLLLSHSRIHGDTPREPWEFGDRAVAIFKKFTELRYRLLPYIFSMENKSVNTGIPFIRPLIIHHQSDRNVWDICDQYYFGDSMMVAPILNESGKRQVYLPEGIWYNFWTGKRINQTGWIDVEVSLDSMPIYIPAGAIIPMGPVMQYVDEKQYEPLDIMVYAGKSNTFQYVNGSENYNFRVHFESGKTVFIDHGLMKNKHYTLHIIE